MSEINPYLVQIKRSNDEIRLYSGPDRCQRYTTTFGIMRIGRDHCKKCHEVWAAGRLAEGWKYGPERNDALRTHPGLVPYEELSETEKDYDRRTAMGTLKLIQKIGFGIKKVKNV